MKKNAKKTMLFSAILSIALICLLSVSSFANVTGDINGDGAANASDARLALRASVGLEQLNETQKYAADVDSDGKVTASDARLILRASVGLEKLKTKGCLTHTYSDYTQVKDAKGNDTGKHTAVCTVCGNKITEACTQSAWTQEKNAYGVATKNHGSSCTKCGGNKKVEACTYGERVWKNEYRDATCTHGYGYVDTCTVCNGKKVFNSPALGHDLYKDESTYVAPTAVSEGSVVWRCNNCTYYETRYTQPTDGMQGAIDFFNNAVNGLKDGTHSYSGFAYSKTKTIVDNNRTKINYSTAMKLLAATMGDEFSEAAMLKNITDGLTADSEANTVISSIQTPIKNDNFFLKNKDIVINLKEADVDSYKKTKINGLDFMDDLGTSIQITSSYGTTYPYSIERYAKANIGEVYKISFRVKEQTLTELNKSSEESILQRVADKDLRTLSTMDMSSMGSDSSDGMESDMKCVCEGASGFGTVTYYFDVATTKPIAATYELNYTISENVTFSFAFNGDSADIPISGKLMDGAVVFTSNTADMYYFFFDNYFPSIID